MTATYHDIATALDKRMGFQGNSMSAYWTTENGPPDSNGVRNYQSVYRVLSYSTAIAEWWPELDGGTYITTDIGYSVTTRRHLGMLWRLERSIDHHFGPVCKVVDSDSYYCTRLKAV